MDIQAKLRQEAQKLLDTKQVDCVLGYEKSDMPFSTTPCFAKNKEDVSRLLWNPFCGNNLAKYLIGRTDKVAIVAKACDIRSIIILIKENQIKRENVIIIATACTGVVDEKKIHAHLAGRNIKEVTLQDRSIHVKGESFDEKLKVDDFLHDSCLVCKHKNPPLFDIMIGEMGPELQPENEYADIEEFEKKTSSQRWEYFNKELSKCIRCYACRQACPLCYCKTCFVDQNFPEWFGKSTDISDTICFHITRALHTTGRCVGCGACVRACPNNIDLRMLTRKIAKDVKELFGDEPGLDLEEETPLASYREDDPQDFIK